MKVTNSSRNINALNKGETSKTQVDKISLGNKGSAAAKVGKQDSVKVDFSELASDIKKVKDMVNADSVDEAKVAHFQSLIDSGRYKVDAGAVADRLLDEHLKMDM